MLNALLAHDPNLVELACGKGSVLLPPSLNGRLFCQLDGELIHRLDAQAMRNPSPEGYDNLGGNSLWPAPEGGEYAFNYPPGGDAWHVQDGISKSIPAVRLQGPNQALVEKRISLLNRKGIQLDLIYKRAVSAGEIHPGAGAYSLHGLCYETRDSFEPVGVCPSADVLIASWSLEQFPGADDIIAFGIVAVPDGKGIEDPINRDFYGDPGDRLAWQTHGFTFQLGGVDRHQIGIKVSSGPTCIGALDTKRSLLFLRKTQVEEGKFFNIADNEQAVGPFSAADLYSIFNGGELGFFELETIGSMKTAGPNLASSVLHSQTMILKGSLDSLKRFLSERIGIHIV